MTPIREFMPDDRAVRGMLSWKDNDPAEKNFYMQAGDTVQLGREADNEVVLNSPHVSRHHAVLVWRSGSFELSDLGSINGTQVNGERLTRPRILRNGDIIRLYDVEINYQDAKEEAPPTEAGRKADKTIVVPSSAPQPHLTVSAGPQEGLEIPLHSGKMIIGRATAKDNWDIALQDRSVSRPHAQLEQAEGNFVLTDLESANGTLVNSICITGPTVLHDGDVIVLGEVSLLFRDK